MNAIEQKPSVLTKSQKKSFRKDYMEDGKPVTIIAHVRHDDQCGNGHNTFSITADIYEGYTQRGEPTVKHSNGKTLWLSSCGCQHEEVAKHFPELAPLIKWHLCSTDGPMHYIANTCYHALQHGPKSAWVYHEDKAAGIDRHCVKYCDMAEAQKICAKPCYTMEIDNKTAKEANYNYARSSAIWPEATDEELSVEPELLKRVLEARLPKLMEEFQSAVESLGFVY